MDEQFGPMLWEDILRMARDGVLSPTDSIRRETGRRWKHLDQMLLRTPRGTNPANVLRARRFTDRLQNDPTNQIRTYDELLELVRVDQLQAMDTVIIEPKGKQITAFSIPALFMDGDLDDAPPRPKYPLTGGTPIKDRPRKKRKAKAQTLPVGDSVPPEAQAALAEMLLAPAAVADTSSTMQAVTSEVSDSLVKEIDAAIDGQTQQPEAKPLPSVSENQLDQTVVMNSPMTAPSPQTFPRHPEWQRPRRASERTWSFTAPSRQRLIGIGAAVGVLSLWFIVSAIRSRGTLPTLPVSGHITLDGQPLKGASVIFVAEANSTGKSCGGATDESGKYTLFFANNSGALAGKYKVMVQFNNMPNDAMRLGAAGGNPGGNGGQQSAVRPTLAKEFSDPVKTPLVAEVTPGSKNKFDFKVGKASYEQPPASVR